MNIFQNIDENIDNLIEKYPTQIIDIASIVATVCIALFILSAFLIGLIFIFFAFTYNIFLLNVVALRLFMFMGGLMIIGTASFLIAKITLEMYKKQK